MKNNSIEEITPEIQQLNDLILQNKYKESYEVYFSIKKKIFDLNNEEEVENLINYLLQNYTNSSNGFLFKTLIENLKINHKAPFILKLIYEDKLVDSIDNTYYINNNKANIIIKKGGNKKNKEKNIEKIREEIELKMKKILEINKYIELRGIRAIMYEKMAENYYDLGAANYNRFCNKKDQTPEELEQIIYEFKECINNYKQVDDYKKKKLNHYQDSLNKVQSHQNILKGKQKIEEEKYEEALKYFNIVNYNNSAMVEEKNKGTYICYERLATLEEDKENYEKSVEYYNKINKYSKVLELNIRINEKNIIDCIKSKNYIETFNYFTNIFKNYNNSRNIEFLEFKYSEISKILIELIIKLAIIAIQNNGLIEYIKTLEDLKDKIEYKDMELKVDSLILEINNLNKIENENLFNFIKNKLIKDDNSEINQRFYLSFLIIKCLKSEPRDSLLLILKPEVQLSYINNESFTILKNYFKEVKDINNLMLISKIFYKIIVLLNMFNNIDSLNCIGAKLIEINKMDNIKNNISYENIIENIVSCFQEIMINNKKIKSYEGLKNILLSTILKDNNIINYSIRGLLFLSNKEIKFDKRVLGVLKNYLCNNKDGNLLRVLLIQYKYQKNLIMENLKLIYEMLLYYQEKNQIQKAKYIIEFMMEIPEELITCRMSINNLENYLRNINIDPLIYDIIKKIPVKKRGLTLSQKLSDYEENKEENNKIIYYNNNLKKELDFKLTIDKEELAEIENNLDTQYFVDKLIYYLKNQKNLIKYVNVEKISKYYCIENKELFDILIEKEINFNNNSLINILQGFYNNNENEIKETFNIFKKIKEYQNKFPEIIEFNIKTEQFLFEKKYELIDKFDETLIEIFNEFSLLCGFANQHQKFILYLLKIPNNDKKNEICMKMIEFLLKNNYNIGTEIFKEIINIIKEEDIINIIPNILIAKNISYSIKKLALFHLYKLIKLYNDDKLLNILKCFKLFIDWIKIPDNLIEYLINLLKKEISNKIYKEIILILGNYSSIKKINQEKYLDEILLFIEKKEIY